jgi:hypothetical protein
MYIRAQQIKFKYSKLLVFDPIKRANYRIVGFVKRHYLITPINILPEQVSDIPPEYRFRCWLYDSDEIFLIEQFFESLVVEQSGDDKDLASVIRMSLEDDKKKQIDCVTIGATKVPVMIDLRIYGENPNIPIMFNDKMRMLDSTTQKNIVKSWDKVKDGLQIERFRQMLSWSKTLAKFYLSKHS